MRIRSISYLVIFFFLLSCSSKPPAPDIVPDEVPAAPIETSVAEEPAPAPEPEPEPEPEPVVMVEPPIIEPEPVAQTPRPKPVARPRRKTRPAPSDEDVVERLIAQIKTGETSIDAPEKLEQEASGRVDLMQHTGNIPHTLDSVLKQARKQGYRRNIEIQMSARLKASNNPVTRTGLNTQLVGNSQSLKWQWRYTARQTGQDKLSAAVMMDILVNSEIVRSLPISELTRGIEVVKTPEKVAEPDDGFPLWIMITAALLLVVIIALIASRKKKPA